MLGSSYAGVWYMTDVNLLSRQRYSHKTQERFQLGDNHFLCPMHLWGREKSLEVRVQRYDGYLAAFSLHARSKCYFSGDLSIDLEPLCHTKKEKPRVQDVQCLLPKYSYEACAPRWLEIQLRVGGSFQRVIVNQSAFEKLAAEPLRLYRNTGLKSKFTPQWVGDRLVQCNELNEGTYLTSEWATEDATFRGLLQTVSTLILILEFNCNTDCSVSKNT